MKAWEQFLTQQEAELGSKTVDTWLRSLKVVHFDACNLYLEAKDSFQLLWFEEHIRAKVLSSLLNNNKKRVKVHLSLVNYSPVKHSSKRVKKNAELSTPALPSFALNFDQLESDHTFENLLISETLNLPHRLLNQPFTSSGAAFNPTYLYGLGSCGKTHLLMAAAQAFKAQGAKVLYTRAETFTEHVVSAIRESEMGVFRQAYRNSDVLLIDDVHLFSNKAATQEELFHTFNAMHLSGKQIILSANCPPGELEGIEPRLVSRFEWGIVLPLSPLKAPEIKQIVKQKVEAMRFPLHEKAIDFLFEIFSDEIKSINRALQALILRVHLDENLSSANSASLTTAQIKLLLNDLILEHEAAALTPQKIIQTTAEYFGIRSEDILGKAQTRECVLPRQIAIHFCRIKLEWPFMKIGSLFNRDHSTIMSSVKAIAKSLEKDVPDVRTACQSILKKLMN